MKKRWWIWWKPERWELLWIMLMGSWLNHKRWWLAGCYSRQMSHTEESWFLARIIYECNRRGIFLLLPNVEARTRNFFFFFRTEMDLILFPISFLTRLWCTESWLYSDSARHWEKCFCNKKFWENLFWTLCFSESKPKRVILAQSYLQWSWTAKVPPACDVGSP